MHSSQPATDRISRQVASHVMLAAQGLDRAPDRPAVKADVLVAVRRMHVLQIDTIHVIARSPYLVLWSRLGDYRPAWLDELLVEGALFENWAHAMCLLPMEDFALYRRRMLDAIANGDRAMRRAVEWSQEHPEVMERVVSQLQKNGAVRSAEFENTSRPPGGWWNWKDERTALEVLLLTGEVMVTSRRNFQRIYELRERVLPGWDDTSLPSGEEMCRTLTLRAVHALGIASAAWIPDYFRQPKRGMSARLEALVSERLLVRIEIEGLAGPAYVHPDRLGLLDEATSGDRQPTLTTLLSPFDPLVWDRQRARELFGFDYLIECYTPAAKRRYGYFTLPILHRGRLIGRLDPKAHRAQGVFEVKMLHLEEGVTIDDELVTGLAAALRRLAGWHGTPDLVVRASDPPALAAQLQAAQD